MPHEIGHYFGTLGKGSLYGDNNTSEDLLMSQGTDGTKVPFEDVIKYFNTNYKYIGMAPRPRQFGMIFTPQGL